MIAVGGGLALLGGIGGVLLLRGDGSGGVLEQGLPDPNEEIPSGRQGFSRVHGRVTVDTTDGSIVLSGDGTSGSVTAIAGYCDAADLRAVRGFATVENDTKRVGANVTFGTDELSFDPDTFRGIALRAVESVDLVVDGTERASRVNLVRYSSDRGVFESRSP